MGDAPVAATRSAAVDAMYRADHRGGRGVSAAWRILHKDLVLELRTREALSGLIVLMLLILLTFTFALDPEGAARRGARGAVGDVHLRRA